MPAPISTAVEGSGVSAAISLCKSAGASNVGVGPDLGQDISAGGLPSGGAVVPASDVSGVVVPVGAPSVEGRFGGLLGDLLVGSGTEALGSPVNMPNTLPRSDAASVMP